MLSRSPSLLPAPPSRWAVLEREGDVRVDERIRKCVIFLGSSDRGTFVPFGTAFITVIGYEGRAFQTLVTAKHVIDRIPGREVYARLNTVEGGARVVPTSKDWWFPHENPEIDVCVCPTGFTREEFDFLHLALDGNETMVLPSAGPPKHVVGLGDEVFVTGMFIPRIGETRNIPVIRMGTVSAMPDERLRTEYGDHEAYLVEVRSIDGLSGSPLFAPASHMLFTGKYFEPNRDFRYYLIGMILGHSEVQNPAGAIEIKQRKSKRPEGKQVRAYVGVNTGIAIALPISYVLEAIHQQKLKDERMKSVEEHKRRHRFVSDSARPSKPESTSDKNPQHKEDFTRLLSAASKPKPKGGRT